MMDPYITRFLKEVEKVVQALDLSKIEKIVNLVVLNETDLIYS